MTVGQMSNEAGTASCDVFVRWRFDEVTAPVGPLAH